MSNKDILIYDGIKRAARVCHQAAVDGGWWVHKKSGVDLRQVMNNPIGPFEELLAPALVSQKLCLIHSEVSEAMEGTRKGLMDDHLPHRPMEEVELADALIRILDLAEARGFDIAGAVVDKLEYNAHRADHKAKNRSEEGGKKF